MPDSSLRTQPEVFLSSKARSASISRAAARHKVRKLATRLYTTNLIDPPEVIIRRNLWPIVGLYFPGALVADRTALENRPAADGSVFLVASKKREILLPGHTLRPRRGRPALESDLPFVGGLRLSSLARAFLENMRPSRTSAAGRITRTLSRSEFEEKLEELLRRSGEVALKRLRDEAKLIAPSLDMAEEAKGFDDLIGALLGSRQLSVSAPAAVARMRGRPFDPPRVDLLLSLQGALRDTPNEPRPEIDRGPEARNTFAFFEAYFSNYIEGTEFEIDEAVEIVFQGRIPRLRPQDAHDILGTYRVVSSPAEMSRTQRTVEEFIEVLRRRHALIMGARPDKRPGEFKELVNRAGATQFVNPELVPGTLAAGFEILRSIAEPFHRAVFMMFLVAEVHPFDDGNGRIARVMMNAELAAEGEQRLIIPTVFRNNYLTALRALSRNRRPDALIRTLDFAQRFSQRMEWSTIDRTRLLLERTNAFVDADDAENRGVRLLMPTGDVLLQNTDS